MTVDKFVACACFGEGLRVTFDSEDRSFNVSMWVQRYRGQTCWRQRLRHICKIIKDGEPWDDEIVLRAEDATALAQFILTPPSVEVQP